MGQPTEIETDFAAMMQKLSERAASGNTEARRETHREAGISTLISAIHSLGQRVESLEESFLRKLETIQFKKIEEQISRRSGKARR